MNALLTYRGRTVTEADGAAIRELIVAHPDASRRQLSYLLCDAWDWRQQNGERRDMVCRGLMLALDRAGHIRLPAVRKRPPNNVVAARVPRAVFVDCTVSFRQSCVTGVDLASKRVSRPASDL